MEGLPVEVISHIFKFLPTVEDRMAAGGTCQLWREAFLSPTLRGDEQVTIFGNRAWEDFMELAVDCARYTNFCIVNANITEGPMDFWSTYGRHVKRLTLWKCRTRYKTLFESLKSCTRLTALTVSKYEPYVDDLHGFFADNEVRGVLAATLSTLKEITLDFESPCRGIMSACRTVPSVALLDIDDELRQDSILDPVRERAAVLQALTLEGRDDGSGGGSPVGLAELARIPELKLKFLKLSNVMVTLEGILSLSQHQTTLTSLVLDMEIPALTDEMVVALCTGLVNLRVLGLQMDNSVSDAAIASLKALRHLQRLTLRGCYFAHGHGLVEGLHQGVETNLIELRLFDIWHLAEESLLGLAESLPRLKVLDIKSCELAVTDRSLQAVCRYNTGLRELRLEQCLGVMTDMGLARASLANLRGLQYLAMSLFSGMSDSMKDVGLLSALVFDDLKRLSLRFFQHLTNAGLVGIVANNRALEALDLEDCSAVGDEGVLGILDSLPRLRALGLHRTRVTLQGIAGIAGGDASLRPITVDYREGKQADRIMIKRKLPNLKFIDIVEYKNNPCSKLFLRRPGYQKAIIS